MSSVSRLLHPFHLPVSRVVDCQTETGITWHYLALACRDFDFCTWSEDDYYGHYWLEKLSHPLFFLSLALPGDETFLFCGGWWVFVWWLVLCFCLCCCFGSVFCFKLSHSLLFTQKLWRFSGLSERALDLLLGLCLGVPSVSRLFNLDCRYPRDQLQPARKKKIIFPSPAIRNLLLATAACDFSTSQLQKVLRDRSIFYHFDLEMCFSPQCEALQNPKSERFYQQLEPTTKQNHTETRSVARVGVKLVELDTKHPKHTRVTTSALKRLFTPQTQSCLLSFVTTFRQPFKCQLETKNMHNAHAVSVTSTEFLNSHQNICCNAQAIFSKHSHAEVSVQIPTAILATNKRCCQNCQPQGEITKNMQSPATDIIHQSYSAESSKTYIRIVVKPK